MGNDCLIAHIVCALQFRFYYDFLLVYQFFFSYGVKLCQQALNANKLDPFKQMSTLKKGDMISQLI